MTIEIINRVSLEKLQRNLVPKLSSNKRGDKNQREFIDFASNDSKDLYKLLRNKLTIDSGDTPPIPQSPLCESEFIDPPWSTELIISQTWDNIPLHKAARPETWTRINLELISKNLICSSFLAARSKGESGCDRIAAALQLNDSEAIDSCVRSIFRRLGGLIPDRANRTVFLDCPIGKAWWRHYYAIEAHKHFNQFSVKKMSDSLRPSYIWQTLIESMISRLTIIGDSSIRPAIVCVFAEGLVNSKLEVEELFRWIGQRCTVQALGMLDPIEIHQMISEEFLIEPLDSTTNA